MRVLIVDDHDLLRRGVKSLVMASGEGLEVCGEAVDGRDAIQKALQLRPDVITMDVTMPNLNGFESTREIHRLLPGSKIIMLSQHNSPETMRQALRAGASGYVVKSAISSELLKAIEMVRQGGSYFDDSVFAKTSAHIDTEQVLQVVTSNMSIAVTRCSRDLRYLWANQCYSDWIGRPLRDIIGRSIQEVIGDEAFTSLSGYFYRVLAGEKVSFEQPVRYHHIGLRWISCVYTPTLGSSGTPDGWVSVIVDITKHKEVEEALRQREWQWRTETVALTKLNDLSSHLWSAGTLKEGLEHSLDAVIEVLSADKGTVHLLDTVRGVLTITAHRGFGEEFLDYFAEVAPDSQSACGRCFRSSERVVIADTDVDPLFAAPYRDFAHRAGYRSVVSTPILDNQGELLGVFSAHFAKPQQPTAESLRLLDLYARQAANFVRRCQTKNATRQAAG